VSVSGAVGGCSVTLMTPPIPGLRHFDQHCTGAAWLRQEPLDR
jgi:hypothetical protein